MVAAVIIILLIFFVLWRGWSILIPQRLKTLILKQNSLLRNRQSEEKHEQKRSRTIRTMIVLGSGGHTTEMLQLIKKLDTEIYSPITFVVASSDSTSIEKTKLDRHLHPNDQFIVIPRSREVIVISLSMLRVIEWDVGRAILAHIDLYYASLTYHLFPHHLDPTT